MRDKLRTEEGRALYGSPNYRHGSIECSPPGTLDDFSQSIHGVPVPLIGHETGQYQVFPDFREIPKYTGVLKARNCGIFRERLEKAGMLNVFMESKGVIKPEEWRQSCAPVVPLLRTEKLTLTADETFTGEIQIAHYGPEDLADMVVTATLSDATGRAARCRCCRR